MHKHLVVFWLSLTVSGCAKDETAIRPAQHPAALPESEAGAPAPDVVVSQPEASTAPPAEAQGPLEQPAECGPARPNPHAVALEWMTRRDGSCKVCEQEPAPLKACAPGLRISEINARTLQSQRGKRVNVKGSLGVTNAMCTKRGGPCACNNRPVARRTLRSPSRSSRSARSEGRQSRSRDFFAEKRSPIF